MKSLAYSHCKFESIIVHLQSWSKLSGQFVLFPIAGMFQHCLGGRGAQTRQRKKNKRCSYNDGSVYSKFSTFRPKFDKCPEVF